jgi:hypothetical protein
MDLNGRGEGIAVIPNFLGVEFLVSADLENANAGFCLKLLQLGDESRGRLVLTGEVELGMACVVREHEAMRGAVDRWAVAVPLAGAVDVEVFTRLVGRWGLTHRLDDKS